MKNASLFYPLSAAILLVSIVGCEEPKPQRDYGFSGGAVPTVARPPLPARTEMPPPPPVSAPAGVAAPVPAVPATPEQETPPMLQAAMPSPAGNAPPAPTAHYIGTVAAPAPTTYVPAATVPAGRRLATLYRYAGQYDEYFVRGDAAVSASPVLEGGVRLAAWDGQNAAETTRVAVATAVYFFSIPPDARALSIQVGYRNAAVTKGSAIAGFLFVRDRAVERRYAATGGDTQGGAFDEPAFYGDTYLLPGTQVQTVIDLAADERVSDGVLELHLSAGAGQALDAQYIQVTALAADLPPTIVRQEVVQEVHDPYMYTYAYYYAGPWACAYPGTYVRYVFFADGLDPFFYGGWITFRSCFWNYHPWSYRPVYYTHRDWDDGRRGHFPPRATPRYVMAYRDSWYRRNFHVDAREVQNPVVIDDRVHRRRVAIADEARRADFQKYTKTIAAEVRDTDHGLKASYGSGFAQRTQEWQRNPAAAARDLKPFKEKSKGLTQAAAALDSLPVKTLPTPRPSARETMPRPGTKGVIPPGASPTAPLPPSPPVKDKVGGIVPPTASPADTDTVQKPRPKKIRTEADQGVPPTAVPPVTAPEASVVTPATSPRPKRVIKTPKDKEWTKTLDDMRGQPPDNRGAAKIRGPVPAESPAGTAAPPQVSTPPAPTPAPTVTAPAATVPADTVKGTPPLPDDKRRKPSRPAPAPEVTAPSAPVAGPPVEVPAPRPRRVPAPLPRPAPTVVAPPAVPDVGPASTVIVPDTSAPADRGQDGTDDKRDKRRGRDRDQQ